MKKLSLNQSAMLSRSAGNIRAFTLTELLVVVCVTGLLAVVLLSAAFTTRERVMRAQCADNLRQIGVGLNVYANGNNGYLPFSGWKQSANPWETYLACRYAAVGQDVTTGVIVEGPYALGSLFFSKAVASAKTFYCPAITSTMYSYNTYNEVSWPWPAAPPDLATNGNGNPYVRCGYNYYPQSRATVQIHYVAHPFTVPALSYQGVTFTSPNPVDGPEVPLSVPVALNMATINPKKSIVTDLVNSTSELSHRASGSVAGLNALFPDGRVTFQNARTDPRTGFNSPWYPGLWTGDPTGAVGPGDSPSAFRIIMSEWRP